MWIDELQNLRRGKRIGGQVEYFPEIDSTNRKARELAGKGAPEGTVVLADAQTGGRGRLGRSWHSPPGSNLYASLVLRPDTPAQTAPQITLMAGVAVARGLIRASGVEARLKWPNDVVIQGKKVAGILSEGEGEGSRVRLVILGMGVNINWLKKDMPAEIREIATSLQAETGRENSRAAVAAEIFQELEETYDSFRGEGFSPRLRGEWNRLSAINGKGVTLRAGEEEISGEALGLDVDGALLLLDERGTRRRFIAGDVSLRTT